GLNENGLAIMISKDDFDCIITGDLPKSCEHKLALSNKLPDTEVYVVGHHGSKTSSSIELLNTILPELAVISVGLDNSYGHPSDSVLGLFSDMGINVLRTDLEQDIILDSSVITTK
ncbi:MAG: DNA internalization-related competence protein ComEC/Rec2, partial [Clostridia bacterium]